MQVGLFNSGPSVAVLGWLILTCKDQLGCSHPKAQLRLEDPLLRCLEDWFMVAAEEVKSHTLTCATSCGLRHGARSQSLHGSRQSWTPEKWLL
nr:prokineticin-2 isoform X14 [Odocoileus virginianus texanus]